jgi:glycosyltransferase involved in cell wall biosynthesis
LRVAYVVSLFPKISETFILREMQALRRRGVEITIVSLKSRREAIVHPDALTFLPETHYVDEAGPAASALARLMLRSPLAAGGALARVTTGCLAAAPGELMKSLPLVAVAARVSRLLGERGIDRVHAHWATYPALVAWAVRRLAGIPYSLTAHAHDLFVPNPLLGSKILESDFTVTISEFNRRHLERSCGDEASRKVHVIHCGVPLEEYPARDPLPPGRGRIVSVGRLVDYKGYAVLLKAVASLRRMGRDLSCDIVGDGPEEPLLRLAIREQGLEGCVRLAGPRPLSEVRDLVRSASVFVLACRRGRGGLMDGIPVVLMEAMALGVPVVSTRISGIPELIEDGRTGLLAEPNDDRGLAEAIDRIHGDATLAASLAAAARRRIEDEFDVEKSALALHALLAAQPREGGR